MRRFPSLTLVMIKRIKNYVYPFAEHKRCPLLFLV